MISESLFKVYRNEICYLLNLSFHSLLDYVKKKIKKEKENINTIMVTLRELKGLLGLCSRTR